jgi:hypothetical protein
MLDVSIAYVRWLSRLGEKKLRRGDEMFRKFEIGLCEKVLVTTPSHLEALEIVGHAYTHAGKHCRTSPSRTTTSRAACPTWARSPSPSNPWRPR